jgi:murein DD-endopeptidase MepM/ murein hydrolase activator NlpD
VKPGETGLAIASAYKVPWRRIATENGIGFDSVIRVGQSLFIPLGPPKAPPVSASPKADPEALARSFRLDIDDLVSGSAVASAAETPSEATPPKPSSQPAPSIVPPLAWPTDGRVILSAFGPKPGGLINEGVIIKVAPGSPVRAAAPGTVIYVGDAIESFGLLMLVRHAGGAITAYGHLADPLSTKGQKVDQGAIIARAGRSGAAKEPQLLFQLRLGRKAVDPLPYLRRERA